MKKVFEKIKKYKKIIGEIIIILCIAIFSYSIAPKTFQNDTYYSVSIGNLILENGIDNKDHYSWHEDLPYTYPHWLYDVIMAKIYNLGDWRAVYISVCVMSIVLGITIYLVNYKLGKNQIISFILAICSMYLLKSYIAARAQLVTFIIFMVILYFIEKFLEDPKKIRYGIGIILLSTLVANLHVAVWPFVFVLSLPYIAEYVICIISDIIIYQKVKILIKKIFLMRYKKDNQKTAIIKDQLEKIYLSNEKRKKIRESQTPYKIKMKKNKNVKWLIVLMLICLLTGFLTPLGTTPFTYLIKTMQGNTTKNINEHLPLTLINNIPIMCVLVITLANLTFTQVKIRLSDLFMLGGLCFLMFSSKRQSTMFVLIGSVILNKMIVEALNVYDIDKMPEKLKKKAKIMIVIITVLISSYLSSKYIKDKKNDVYVNAKTYPVQAAEWIIKNLDINNIKLFNEYNYGSYLLYKGIPVFIDSRADLYAPEFNGREDDIFMDFINTSSIGKYYGTTFNKYGITHVILYKNSKISMLIDKADKEKYQKIYSDDNFVIYEVTDY